MSDPTLKRSSVTINYTASDGYRRAVNYSNRGQMGRHPPPELPLLDAIEELSRLCSLFGFGEQAAQRVAEARERVDAWRTERSKTPNASLTGASAEVGKSKDAVRRPFEPTVLRHERMGACLRKW